MGSAATLAGGKVHDEGPNFTSTFPTFTLGAGGRVKLHTGSGPNSATDLYWGQGGHVWNNTGTENAYLLNSAGAEVTSKRCRSVDCAHPGCHRQTPCELVSTDGNLHSLLRGVIRATLRVSSGRRTLDPPLPVLTDEETDTGQRTPTGSLTVRRATGSASVTGTP
jgi:hypothetical protein